VDGGGREREEWGRGCQGRGLLGGVAYMGLAKETRGLGHLYHGCGRKRVGGLCLELKKHLSGENDEGRVNGNPAAGAKSSRTSGRKDPVNSM